MSDLSTWLQEALHLDYRIAGNFRGIQFSRMTVKPRKLNQTLTQTCSCALSMGVATLACSRSISDRHTVIECPIRVLRTSLLLLSGFNGNVSLYATSWCSRHFKTFGDTTKLHGLDRYDGLCTCSHGHVGLVGGARASVHPCKLGHEILADCPSQKLDPSKISGYTVLSLIT